MIKTWRSMVVTILLLVIHAPIHAQSPVGTHGIVGCLENCRIHHMLSGTFKEQSDAHGINGHWGDVAIRNCDISYTSGDREAIDLQSLLTHGFPAR